MTDQEVQKLSRNDLLALLLEVQEENEALIAERDRLAERVQSLQAQLQTQQSEPVITAEDASDRAAELLKEARATADDMVESRRTAQRAVEQQLRERELRIRQREEQLHSLEAQQKTLLDAANRATLEQHRQAESSASDTLRLAREEAARILRDAEAEAARTTQKAAKEAELLLQRAQEDSNSFWEDITEQLRKHFPDIEGI